MPRPNFDLRIFLAKNQKCLLNLHQKRYNIYNPYRRGPTSATEPPKVDPIEVWRKAFSREGVELVKKEIKRIVKKPFREDKMRRIQPGVVNKFEDFDNDEFLKKWNVVLDADHNGGYSSATLTRSVNGHALFKGYIDTRPPPDGMMSLAGFAGMIGPEQEKDDILGRENPWNWRGYNAVEVRLRGDGRKYNFLISTARDDIDLTWFDARLHPLHTRGGPYWQTFRIPLSRFILTSKGSIQDNQPEINLAHIPFIGITLNDMLTGPFQLEVDYVGLVHDIRPFFEHTAWEMYRYRHIDSVLFTIDGGVPEPITSK